LLPNKRGMNKQAFASVASDRALIRPPAYPFTARDLLGELQVRLSNGPGQPLSFERLGKMVGRSKSTVHHWFTIYCHPHLLAFMCLLERLTPGQRQEYIEAHCRTFPTLNHPALVHSSATGRKLIELLEQQAGLTIVTGGTEFYRSFMLTALGHTYCQSTGRDPSVVGLDLVRPGRYVPIPSVVYIDGAIGLKQVRQLTCEVWPKLLTSPAPLLVLNGVWSSLPEVRRDVVRCSGHKHVILAEGGEIDLADMKNKFHAPVHVLSLSTATHVKQGIRVDCRCIKRGPGRKKMAL
jgi:hypothetical protein